MLTIFTIHSDIFVMTTVVGNPSCGSTVKQTRLGTITVQIIQPYWIGTLPISGLRPDCNLEQVPTNDMSH
ncbi:hypothetical protein DPMN_052351 [Dreissena polymorpha]|uniref:Uncharacterized protein n=1 Tax=Dreissena polymorpha TaxID=45954 RepID=A0A9D4CJJ4_DREPO|nr:hypothetical protein DPMN_052351 [Dreissena polymorpha]